METRAKRGQAPVAEFEEGGYTDHGSHSSQPAGATRPSGSAALVGAVSKSSLRTPKEHEPSDYVPAGDQGSLDDHSGGRVAECFFDRRFSLSGPVHVEFTSNAYTYSGSSESIAGHVTAGGGRDDRASGTSNADTSEDTVFAAEMAEGKDTAVWRPGRDTLLDADQ